MKSTNALPDFLNDLQQHITGELRTDDYSRVLYSTDASLYQVMPHGVLIPRTLEDVHAAVELAARYQIPLLPRGAGSSLAGQAVNEALIIDMTHHLNQVLEVNPEEGWVRAQPGLVLDELNRRLKPTGLQFGPDPASSNRASVGGIVANNSSGSHSILYGMTSDHVLETNVILSDGSRASFGRVDETSLAQRQTWTGLEGDIYRHIGQMVKTKADVIQAGTPRHWRRCGGYNLSYFVDGVAHRLPNEPHFNLAKLICGSEGTLGVITDVRLNLTPRPTQTALAVVQFDQLRDALMAVSTILQVEPSAVELLDHLSMSMCREVPAFARLLTTFIEGEPNSVLLTEFYGEDEAELKAKIERLTTHLNQEKVGATAVIPLISPQLQSNVWAVRKSSLGLLMSMKGDYKPVPFIEDAAVPVEYLADYVAQIEQFCNDLGSKAAYYAHASAGCLHVRPLINTKLAVEIEKLSQISAFAVELLGEYGGALSSEHGDGRARSWLNERLFGPELYGLYREVKQAFDPHNLLNPGNIVDAPPMTEHLRFGADYQTIPIKEHLDFSEEMGFHRAVEMCNGAGICRKKTSGTMCPSFMVTQEEMHSTRGRANALRAALSGNLPAEELTSSRMYEVMDLCIECKACKSECPSSVDMAKIKFEFLAQYYEKHRVPLRTTLFADIAFWSRLSSGLTAPLANWCLENGLIRWALEKFIGISRRRTLPPFATQPFTRWFKQRQKPETKITNIIEATTQNPNPKPVLGEAEGSQISHLTSQISHPTSHIQDLTSNRVVLFNDTFNTYNYPQVAIAATEVLEAAGFEVSLPGHQCCGRPMISKGMVSKARRAARDTVDRLFPFAEVDIPIVGLEPSCILSFRDEYVTLLPGDHRVKTVADQCYTFEEFIAKLADEGQLELDLTDEARELLLHGHCHQKALVGTGPSKRTLTLPAGYSVTEVDSGCCGMAGSFGYEAEHYDISLAMAERRLLPAVRRRSPETIVAAAGVSCRQQISHGTGVRAFHPAEILRAALK
jgi:FAD/FMN-containing dehydrogenase/Fe-S oxidoreductase